MREKFSAIILCAGSSERMGTGKSKILEKIKDKTVFEWTLSAFEQAELISDYVVVCRSEEKPEFEALVSGFKKFSGFVIGGNTRQESTANAAEEITAEHLVIHDGARPLITPKEIDALCCDAEVYQASAICAPAQDTFKQVDINGFITATVPRENLVHVQTPQVFMKSLYMGALEKAQADGMDFTDDCQLIEYFSCPVHLVVGSHRNMKITTKDDLLVAEALLGGEI